jgi:Uma2 family endonuclease
MRVAPSPDTDIRELFDGIDLGVEYRVELIDDRISVRSALSLRRCLIQAWLVYQLHDVIELAGWMGLGVQGPVVLPSGDRIRPDLAVVRRGHLSTSGAHSEHVRLVGEIVTGSDEYEAEETTRQRCSLADIPLYLRIDAVATPATITLYTRPQGDEYQGMTRVVAGDDLHLPDPFGIALDTASLPLG